MVAETVRLRRNFPMVDTVPTGRVPDLEGCCYIGGLLLRVQRRNNEVPGGAHRMRDAEPLLMGPAARRTVRCWRCCMAGRSRQIHSCQPLLDGRGLEVVGCVRHPGFDRQLRLIGGTEQVRHQNCQDADHDDGDDTSLRMS